MSRSQPTRACYKLLKAYIIISCIVSTRANLKLGILYSTLSIVSSWKWTNAMTFQYTMQININSIKLMVNHEIIEPHKLYSCQSNSYVSTYPRYVICILFELFRLENFSYKLYNFILFHIKLVDNGCNIINRYFCPKHIYA